MSRHPGRIARDEAPRVGTLADLRRNRLDLRLVCLACARWVDLDIDALIAAHGAETTVQAIYDRAVCKACGERAHQMQLADRAPPMLPRKG